MALFAQDQVAKKYLFISQNIAELIKILVKAWKLNISFSKDSKGRKCAAEVRPLKGHKKNSREIQQKILSILLSAGFASVIYILFISRLIPLALVGLYAVMSVIAFAMYAKDKSAAGWGTHRTPENTLHTLSLLGGWPGAAVAQSFLRHKSKKLSFRLTYWVTVIVNCAGLYWLVTPEGSMWLHNILKNINLG